MKKAVIYARFSCSNQTEQSIDGQLRVCRDYAKRNDILIVGQYIDRAKSGTTDARPSFQQMINDSAKNDWDYVLVYKLDRFSRDKYDTAIYKKKLKDNGIKVISATENIPDTPEAIIFESVIEGFAQYYSAELSQKVKRGLNESYLKGLFTGGTQLLGYDLIDKKNYINEYEKNIVIEIFQKFADGYNALEIAQSLKKRNILNKNGKEISDKVIYKMLANPKYNGRAIHDGVTYTNIYPKIVDDELWAKVEDIHIRNRIRRGVNYANSPFILTGRLTCGECGTHMIGVGSTNKVGKRYHYYSCRAHGYNKKCPNKVIPKDWLEGIVLEATYKLFKDIGLMERIVEYECDLLNNSVEDENTLIVLEKQRDIVQKQLENVTNAISNGVLTDSVLDTLRQHETKLNELNEAINKERIKIETQITPEQVTSYIETAMLGDSEETLHFKKKIVKNHIKEIVIYKDKIVITYYLTTPTTPDRDSSDKIGDVEIYTDEAAYEKAASFSFNITLKSKYKVPQHAHNKFLRKYRPIVYIRKGVFFVIVPR